MSLTFGALHPNYPQNRSGIWAPTLAALRHLRDLLGCSLVERRAERRRRRDQLWRSGNAISECAGSAGTGPACSDFPNITVKRAQKRQRYPEMITKSHSFHMESLLGETEVNHSPLSISLSKKQLRGEHGFGN